MPTYGMISFRWHFGNAKSEVEDGIGCFALFDMANMKMPYGKFKGWALVDLPEPYVVWINNNNLPQGKLGKLLQLLLTVKVNGLEHLIHPLKGKELSQLKYTGQFGGRQ